MVYGGTYTAELDRFHEGVAVLVLERDGQTVEELAVDRSALPTDARHGGAVFTVRVAAGRIVELDYHTDRDVDRGDGDDGSGPA
jgi:hypothetical protein